MLRAAAAQARPRPAEANGGKQCRGGTASQLGGALQDPRTRHAVTAAIHRLETVINEAVISRIIQDMADITRYLII